MSRERACDTDPIVLRQPALLAALGLAALALAACGTTEQQPPPPPICPSALLLQGAERTAAYAPGAERRPSALRYLAVMTNLVNSCRFGAEGVDLDLAFDLIAERGPALSGDAVDLTYFIATIGPGRQIISKQVLNSDIAFATGESIAGVNEQLSLRLPAVTPDQGHTYGVYLGFQLDEAELAERLQPLLR